MLSFPDIAPEPIARVFPWLASLAPAILAQVQAEAFYAPYLERQAAELRARRHRPLGL